MKYEGEYLTFEEKDGKLVITLTDDGREELEEHIVSCDDPEFGGIEFDQPTDYLFVDLCEDIFGNSAWELVYPEEIAALTGALILSYDVRRDDYGKIEQIGTCYAYDRYAIDGYVDPLWFDGEMVWEGYE